MYALAEDHRNDVASNIVALACGLIGETSVRDSRRSHTALSGSYALRNRIRQEVVVVDPAGAIVISVYIILAWIRQANRKTLVHILATFGRTIHWPRANSSSVGPHSRSDVRPTPDAFCLQLPSGRDH